MSDRSMLSPKFVHGVYIPAGLLIAGVAIVKSEWLPYAVASALAIGSFKIFNSGYTKTLHETDFKDFQLVAKTEVNYNTALYRFKLPSDNHILGLPTGQHVTLMFANPKYDPTNKEFGPKQVLRSYTPITDDTTPGHFELMIKHVPGGAMSDYVNSLKIEDTIKIRGPKGKMVYKANMSDHILMVAGGSGITPMLQVIKAIERNKDDTTKVVLIFANVTPADILLKEDLDKLDRLRENITVKYVLDKPADDWKGYTGYVTVDMLKTHVPKETGNAHVFVCGPAPMVNGVKKIAQGLGYTGAGQIFAF